jgi:WD40 repeat protein
VKSRLLPLVLVPLFTLFSTVALGQSSASPGSATAHPDLVLQVGHAKPISALAFSPDGKWLASGSDDLTIKIWDLATGSVVRTIQSGTRIATLAISPDAKLLAAGHGVDLLSLVLSQHLGDPSYAIDLWDVATGRTLRTLSSHAFSVQGMAFSRDGHELTSVSGDAIRKWDVDTGSAKTSVAIDYGKNREVLAAMAQAVVSPDGRFAAVAEFNKPFKIYDAATGKELTDTRVKADYETTMTFSADGQLVAFLLRDRAVIRAVHGGPDLHVLATGASAMHAKGSLIFSPDGRTLVTLRPAVGIYRGETKVWDATSGTLAREIGPVVSNRTGPLVSFSPDGRIIAEIAGTGMKLINLVSGREELVLSSEETVPIEETDIYRAVINNPKMMASLKKNAGLSTPDEIKA